MSATTKRLTRVQRTALTRRELLDVAERRFFADGYHGTTLEGVADEAGYTKGAVYSTFKSKGGLFLALLDDVVERRLSELRTLVAEHGIGEQTLAALAQQPVDERNTQFALLSIEFLVHAAHEPALLRGFAERYRRMRSGLAEIGPAADGLGGSERWAMITMALSNGLVLERLIDPEALSDDAMAIVQARLLRRTGV